MRSYDSVLSARQAIPYDRETSVVFYRGLPFPAIGDAGGSGEARTADCFLLQETL